MVVINLGTNDAWVTRSTPGSTFQSAMTAFLANVRAKYPSAEIFVMRTFAGVYVTQTQAAVDARIAAGDSHVQYIDTTGWLSSGDYNSDGGHPHDGGHVKIADNLMLSLPSCR
jgi:lysophospholipase L1-like esterase